MDYRLPLASDLLVERSHEFLNEQREKFPEGVIKGECLNLTFLSLHGIVNDDLLQDLSQVRKVNIYSNFPLRTCELDLNHDYHVRERHALLKLFARCSQLTHVWIRMEEYDFPQSLLTILASHSGDSLRMLDITNFEWGGFEDLETHYLRHFPNLETLKISDDIRGPTRFNDVFPLVPPESKVEATFSVTVANGYEYVEFCEALKPYVPNFRSIECFCRVVNVFPNDLWRCEHVARALSEQHMDNFHTEEFSVDLLVDMNRFDLSYFSLNGTEKAVRSELRKIESLIEEAFAINEHLRPFNLPEFSSGACDERFELMARKFSSKLGSSTPERNERFSVLLNDFLEKLDELKRLTSPLGYIYQFLIE